MERRLRSIGILIVMLVLTSSSAVLAAAAPAGSDSQGEGPLGVVYRTHIQNLGDQPQPEGSWVAGPEAMGTRGQSLRMEGFWIELTGAVPVDAGITYQVHVQNRGWMTPVSNGAFAGTSGQSLRIEAIRISLDNLEDYDVYYRGHVQNRGDLPQTDGSWGWVKNGADLGTTGSSLRLEELEVKIVRRDTSLTVYNELIETIGKLAAADYTPESWATLQAAITANTVTEASLQTDVDAATAAIEAAYEALALKVMAVYDVPGTYGPETGSETIAGSVVITVSGVTLQNLVIEGDLTIAESVGDGNATLNNLRVAGSTNIYGGGTGATTQTAGTLTVQNGGGGIVINGGEYSEIQIIKSEGSIQIYTFDTTIGEYLLIKEVPEDEEVILEGHFSKVSVAGAENINLRINEGSRVDTLYAGYIELEESLGGGYIDQPASGLTVRGSGSIGTLGINRGTNNVTVGVNVGEALIYGDNATFTGTVNNATNDGKNSRFKTEPGTVEGVQPVIDPTLESPNGEPEPPVTPPVTPPVNYTAVTAASISGNAVVGQTLTAGTTPTDATATYQWMRSDSADGTYTNISAATAKTYVLTADDAGKYVKVTVTGSGSYNGTVTSGASAAVAITDTDKVATAKSNLTLGDISAITADLTLPLSQDDATVSWGSNNLTVIAADGSVTRPTAGSGNATVILTATLTVNAVSDTKTFEVTVLQEVETDADKVATAKSNLTLGDISAITADLTLPLSQDDATVSWGSNNLTVIAADGSVTRPTAGSGNATVILTATLTVNAVSDTKTFEVTVLQEVETDADKVATAKSNLTLGDISAITANLTLPLSQDDATVSWGSNNLTVIAADGSVTRPTAGSGNATVILTATLTVNAASDTKTFEVTVLQEIAGSSSAELVITDPDVSSGTSGSRLGISNILNDPDINDESGVDAANAICLKVTIPLPQFGDEPAFDPVTDNATVEIFINDGTVPQSDDDMYPFNGGSSTITFYDDNNTIWVKITSEDGTVIKYYKITVSFQ